MTMGGVDGSGSPMNRWEVAGAIIEKETQGTETSGIRKFFRQFGLWITSPFNSGTERLRDKLSRLTDDAGTANNEGLDSRSATAGAGAQGQIAAAPMAAAGEKTVGGDVKDPLGEAVKLLESVQSAVGEEASINIGKALVWVTTQNARMATIRREKAENRNLDFAAGWIAEYKSGVGSITTMLTGISRRLTQSTVKEGYDVADTREKIRQAIENLRNGMFL